VQRRGFSGAEAVQGRGFSRAERTPMETALAPVAAASARLQRWKGTASAVPKEKPMERALAPVAAAKAAFHGSWCRRTEVRLFHRYKFQTGP